MKSLEEILKEGFKKDFIDRHKYVSQEFQDYGYRLAMKLGELPRVSMFIKLAKEKPRAILDQAFSFAVDYPNAQNKSKLFLWKLKELEKERADRLKEKNKGQKFILVDLDGVVINEKKKFSERYSEKYGVDIDKLQPFFKGEFGDCLIGKKDLRKVLKKYLKNWEWKGTVDELIKFWIEEDLEYNEKVIEQLKALDRNKYKIFIATNQEQYRAQYLKEKMAEVLPNSGMFASSNLKIKKKDPKFFEKILNLLFIEPNQVYYVDDEEDNIRAAEKKGINVYLYPQMSVERLINETKVN